MSLWTSVAECSAHTVPLQRFSVTATRAGRVFTVAENKLVSSSSLCTLLWVNFSKCGVLNAVKRLFLLITKTFHNNWYLKQHECGLIWVWFTWIDLQIYPSCGASHSESTLRNVRHVRWRHIVLECRVFCFRSLFIHFFVDQLNGSHYF